MAKKQAPEDPAGDAAPVVDPIPERRNPRTTIGLDTNGVVAYRDVTDPDWRYDRAITIDGVRYEHTDTDADGVWIYRSMK